MNSKMMALLEHERAKLMIINENGSLTRCEKIRLEELNNKYKAISRMKESSIGESQNPYNRMEKIR